MSGKEIICINCPVGCLLRICEEGGKIIVEGNACNRGASYGKSEFTAPVRMVTSVMRLENSGKPLPVRLSKPVAKTLISGVLHEIARAFAPANARQYDVLIENVLDSGADVVASADA